MKQDTQAREKQSSSIQITLSRHKGTSSTDGPMMLRKEWVNKGEIRLSIRGVLMRVAESKEA